MRIAIADDHPLVRSGIQAALARDAGIEVVAQASTGDEALQAVVQHQPDLLLLDLSMPGLPFEQLISRATQAHPALKVLIVTAHDEGVFVRRLSQLPIHGYLLKDEAPDCLLQAIHVIEKGAVWFSQSVVQQMMGLGSQTERDCSTLTRRETEILELLSRGEDNSAIAGHLNLAEQTVRNYVSTIYEKIQVNSRAMAVVWARAHDIA